MKSCANLLSDLTPNQWHSVQILSLGDGTAVVKINNESPQMVTVEAPGQGETAPERKGETPKPPISSGLADPVTTSASLGTPPNLVEAELVQEWEEQYLWAVNQLRTVLRSIRASDGGAQFVSMIDEVLENTTPKDERVSSDNGGLYGPDSAEPCSFRRGQAVVVPDRGNGTSGVVDSVSVRVHVKHRNGAIGHYAPSEMLRAPMDAAVVLREDFAPSVETAKRVRELVAKKLAEPSLSPQDVADACANFLNAGLANFANGKPTPENWLSYIDSECESLRNGAWRGYSDKGSK